MKAGKITVTSPAYTPQDAVSATPRAIAIPYPPGYSARIAEEPAVAPHFSPREKQVGGYLAEGFTDTEIADRLELGLHGVKAHVKQLLRKTNTRGRTQLQAWIWRDRIAAALEHRGPAKRVKYT